MISANRSKKAAIQQSKAKGSDADKKWRDKRLVEEEKTEEKVW